MVIRGEADEEGIELPEVTMEPTGGSKGNFSEEDCDGIGVESVGSTEG